MRIALLAISALALCGFSSNPHHLYENNTVYDSQLNELVGQSYLGAVEVLGLPIRRDLREGDGEIWTFVGGVPGREYTQYDASKFSAAYINERQRTTCTTRLSINTDGTVAEYFYYGPGCPH